MNLHDRDIRWIALAEGRKEGAEQKAIENAKNMILQSVGTLEQISSITGLAVEEIARCTDLPLEKVQELANITQN